MAAYMGIKGPIWQFFVLRLLAFRGRIFQVLRLLGFGTPPKRANSAKWVLYISWGSRHMAPNSRENALEYGNFKHFTAKTRNFGFQVLCLLGFGTAPKTSKFYQKGPLCFQDLQKHDPPVLGEKTVKYG